MENLFGPYNIASKTESGPEGSSSIDVNVCKSVWRGFPFFAFRHFLCNL